MTTSASAERWQRLGALLIQRRTALYPRRSRGEFSEATGLSYRLVYDIEQARRTNFGTTVIGGIEAAYRLASGAIARFLDGSSSELEPQAPPSPPLTVQPHSPGHRSRLFAEMPRKMQAAVEPFVAKIQAAVAEAVWTGVPLTGDAVFPDSPLNARRWDAVAERGRMIYPDEGGFTPSEIAELVAIMQIGDTRQESGGAAAGLPGRRHRPDITIRCRRTGEALSARCLIYHPERHVAGQGESREVKPSSRDGLQGGLWR